jgi:hypothetical protein
MSFDLLRFIACRAEVIDDFEHRLREQARWHFTSVIELER